MKPSELTPLSALACGIILQLRPFNENRLAETRGTCQGSRVNMLYLNHV
jgi:hypothetical protein